MNSENHNGGAMNTSDKFLVKYAEIYRQKHGELPESLEERVSEVTEG